jgi:NADH dehydrogenase
MNRIVLTGGTGFVGREIAARAAERWPGTHWLVPTRHLAAGRHLQLLPNVDLLACDVHDAAQIRPLLEGADALVHCVAILHGDAAAFGKVHVALPRTLAAACQASGVRRVVHLSALAVASDAPSNYLRSKAAGEAVWRASGLDATMLRPSVIFGEEDRFTNLFASLQKVMPVLPLAGAQARFQPVWVRDVADAVLTVLEHPERGGPVVECAGPEVLTLKEIVQRVGRMAGCERPVVGLPEGLARLQAGLMALKPGEPLMSADNLLSMRVPSVASGQFPGLAALGLTPSSLDCLIPHYQPRPR